MTCWFARSPCGIVWRVVATIGIAACPVVAQAEMISAGASTLLANGFGAGHITNQHLQYHTLNGGFAQTAGPNFGGRVDSSTHLVGNTLTASTEFEFQYGRAAGYVLQAVNQFDFVANENLLYNYTSDSLVGRTYLKDLTTNQMLGLHSGVLVSGHEYLFYSSVVLAVSNRSTNSIVQRGNAVLTLTSPSPSAVPEPTSLGLIGIGAVLCFAARLRRSSRHFPSGR